MKKFSFDYSICVAFLGLLSACLFACSNVDSTNSADVLCESSQSNTDIISSAEASCDSCQKKTDDAFPGIESDDNGTIYHVENVDYVFDNGEWREATETEITVGKGCVEALNDSMVMVDRRVRQCVWSERESYWSSLATSKTPKNFFFNESVKYDSVSDKRDGRVYRTVEIAGKTWMAENLAYAADGADCSNFLTTGCFYDWHTALAVGEKDTIASGKTHRGICMDGFHVPDSTEWNVVLDLIPLDNLKSYVSWPSGTNESGFSVVPMNDVMSYTPIERYAEFVVANYSVGHRCIDLGCMEREEAVTVYGYAASFDSMVKFALMVQRNKGSSRGLKAALRCVKDSE